MKEKVYPTKLKSGDIIQIITPSRSMKIISPQSQNRAQRAFENYGLKVTYGSHVNATNQFNSTSIEARVADIHAAFLDTTVSAIFSAIGGYNANQLLDYINWDIIAENPKIFCGFSDLTILLNAIFAKTGLVTYHGPTFSTFSNPFLNDYCHIYFHIGLFKNEEYSIMAAQSWSDDEWWLENSKTELLTNEGYLAINKGSAEGVILGGNLCTFNLLQGTEYMPNLSNSILFIEDDHESSPETFDRDLQSLTQHVQFKDVKGLVIGRFQKASKITFEKLIAIIRNKKALQNIPVIANVDFGHTEPKTTFPIGGTVRVFAEDKSEIKVITH